MSAKWGVRVNEVGIFANGPGAGWWAEAIAPWEVSGRAVCLGLCPQGGVWFLPAGGKDDAQWARDHIVSHGMPAKFVKVVKASKVAAAAGRGSS